MGEDLVFFCTSDVGSTIKAKWNEGKQPNDDVTIDGINIVKTAPTKQVDGVIAINYIKSCAKKNIKLVCME